jgi:ClpP class serine protease
LETHALGGLKTSKRQSAAQFAKALWSKRKLFAAVFVIAIVCIGLFNGIPIWVNGEQRRVRWDISTFSLVVDGGAGSTSQFSGAEAIYVTGEINAETFAMLRSKLGALRDRHVLIVVDSGGGYVSSVQQCVDYMLYVKRRNNLSYTAYLYYALSGAYLLSAVCDHVYASPVAVVGGLGSAFIITQSEWIKTDVITHAKYKNMTELTEEQRQMLLDVLSEIDRYYAQLISKRRGLDEGYVRDELLTGYMFSASEAARKGLVDEVASYDEVLLKVGG